MDNLIRGIRVLHQNAIRIEADGRVLYFDPYGVQDAPHDADYIFVTHDHYDHFSPEDIGRVSKADTTLVVPESARPQRRPWAWPCCRCRWGNPPPCRG